jgi:hypothetical protein
MPVKIFGTIYIFHKSSKLNPRCCFGKEMAARVSHASPHAVGTGCRMLARFGAQPETVVRGLRLRKQIDLERN